MRFGLLVAGTLAAGGWTAGVTQGVLPLPEQMSRAVTALGGDPSKVVTGKFDLLRIYTDVMRQVTSGRTAPPITFVSSSVTLPPGGFPVVNTPTVLIGPTEFNGARPDLVPDARQSNPRMERVETHVGGPPVWHGRPSNDPIR